MISVIFFVDTQEAARPDAAGVNTVFSVSEVSGRNNTGIIARYHKVCTSHMGSIHR